MTRLPPGFHHTREADDAFYRDPVVARALDVARELYLEGPRSVDDVAAAVLERFRAGLELASGSTREPEELAARVAFTTLHALADAGVPVPGWRFDDAA